MRLKLIALGSFLTTVVSVVAQSDSLPFLPPGYEEVSSTETNDYGAIEKCGEGATKGVKVCVPYYQCDPVTNTVMQAGRTDGFGIIDIRFGANTCEHPLDVCCRIGEGGLDERGDDDHKPIINNPEPPPVETPKDKNPPVETPEDKIPPPVETPEDKNPSTSAISCGIRNTNGVDFKITGNNHNEAEYGEFPWMVAILRKNFNPKIDRTLSVCGGSLLAPNVVLTGAHCVYKFKTAEIKIRAGEWDTQTEKERLPYQERDVLRIIIHNDFNSNTLFNDVALLILSSPVKFTGNVGNVCLPQPGEHVDSKYCYASGWGKNVFGKQGEYQVILKKIQLPIVNHDKCQDALKGTRLGKFFQLHESFTCAGGEAGKDTCTGDGGSPLVCPDSRNPELYIQAGIVAWGIGCGEERVPGVYADISKFRNWIDNELKILDVDPNSYTAY